jgi:hypothetical protein
MPLGYPEIEGAQSGGGDVVVVRGDAVLGIGDDRVPVHRGPLGRVPRHIRAEPGLVAPGQLHELGCRHRGAAGQPGGRQREPVGPGRRVAGNIDGRLNAGERRRHDFLVSDQLPGVFAPHLRGHDCRRVVGQRQIPQCQASHEFGEGPGPRVLRGSAHREGRIVQLGQHVGGDPGDFAFDEIHPAVFRCTAVADLVVVAGPRNADPLAHAVVGETGEVLVRLHPRHAPDVAEGAVHGGMPAEILGPQQVLDIGRGPEDPVGLGIVGVLDRELAPAQADRQGEHAASDLESHHVGRSPRSAWRVRT